MSLGSMRFSRPIPILVALIGALLVGCIWIAGGAEEVLAVVPVLALLLALACNRYPGEELIEVLARRLRRRRPRPVSIVPPEHAGGGAIALRLLLLLAGVRPLRGPPAPSSHSI